MSAGGHEVHGPSGRGERKDKGDLMSEASMVATETIYDAQELIGLLDRQLGHCRLLHTLLHRQRSAITADDPQRLLEVLERRRGILETLSEVSKRLGTYQAAWPRVRERLNEADRRRVDALAREVNEKLADILKTDEEDAKLLAARKSMMTREMSELKTGRQAGNAYAAGGTEQPTQVEWTDA